MKRIITVILPLMLIAQSANLVAFEISTHEKLNKTATNQSLLDGYLISNLGFTGGVKQSFNGQTVTDWIIYGGAFEDQGNWYILGSRYRNHFHNPLKPWSQAGLNDLAMGESSLLWAQRPTGTQQNYGNWSWHDARDYFYQALTGTNTADRDAAFAKTFQAVGQVMHLVEDASVPAHTRNDAHIFYNYERWVRANENFLNTIPISPTVSLSVSIDGKVPITQFWDTNQYDGTLPLTGTDIGMAEYANANFLSDDTIFLDDPSNLHYFPYPNKSLTELWVDPTNNRQYLRNFGRGELQQHLAAVSSLYAYRLRYFPQYNSYLPLGLDDLSYQEQASYLVPRAVGYSAGLLDYFFRGQLSSPKTVMFNEDRSAVSFKVFNQTPGEEAGPGELIVLARYQDSNFGEISILSDPVSVPGLARTETEAQAFSFAFPPNKIIPINAEDLNFTVVFRGQLGAEADAVMGAVFFPKPHYVFVIQEGVTLGSSGAKRETICTYPSCESTGNLLIIYDREFRDRRWSVNSQNLNGRFVTYGEIKRIDLQYFTGSVTLSGEGKLFINEQEMVKGYWEIGDTPDPPATWRVEVDPSLVNVTYLLTVRMGDDSTFILGLASYRSLYQEVYKEWGVPYCGICSPAKFVFTYSYAEMGVHVGHWLTPDLSIGAHSQWELVQLSGYGPDAGFSKSRWEPPPPDESINFYRDSLGISIFGYQQESSFLCNPCYSVDSNTYAEDLYASLRVPDYFPLTVTGRYHRIYTQAELDALSVLEIQPECYDLVFN